MKKAFTIIELLVVIAVLAILIKLVIPRFKAMEQNSNVAKAYKELNVLKGALESYKTFDSSHTYPPTTTTLTASYLSLASPKITNVIYDPFGSTSTSEYKYLRSGNGIYYVIWSVGLSGDQQPTAISNTGIISF